MAYFNLVLLVERWLEDLSDGVFFLPLPLDRQLY